MKATHFIWILVALCYLIPYVLLTRVNTWYGSFLFWTLAGVATIILNLLATRWFLKAEDDHE